MTTITAWGNVERIDCKWFNPSLVSRISARNDCTKYTHRH